MNWWLPHNFEQKRSNLERRAQIMLAIRDFFDARDFLEVETPILQICPTVDTHIHGIRADILEPDMVTGHERYLQTSPEFDMKKLLVAGLPRIYQICKVFRNGEAGRLHSPEFTMLEWYRARAEYTDIMDDSVDLLRHVAETIEVSAYRHGGKACDPFGDWQRISVAEAFDHYAGIDLAAYLEDAAGFRAAINATGIRTTDSDGWDDLFHAVMAEKIEPHLGQAVPAILYDYPASMAALARKKPDDPRWAERFELYVCGVELANAFGELTDAQEQRARMEADLKKKQEIYGRTYLIDEGFLQSLQYGIPKSSGIALGVDRLIMLAAGTKDIRQVMWVST